MVSRPQYLGNNLPNPLIIAVLQRFSGMIWISEPRIVDLKARVSEPLHAGTLDDGLMCRYALDRLNFEWLDKFLLRAVTTTPQRLALLN